MPRHFLKGRRARLFALVALVLGIVVSGWALGGRSLFASAIKTVSKPKAEARFLQAPQPVRGRATQLVHVAVYDAGVYPREIHVPAGTVRLMVEDYSSGDGGFQVAPATANVVERMAATAPSTISLPTGERRGELTLTLTAGEHRFGRSQNAPETRLRIFAE